MMSRRNTGIVLTCVAVVASVAIGWGFSNPPQPTTNAVPIPANDKANKNGVLRYPPGAPQLAEIHSGFPIVAPLPLSEPLNARLAYDESVTARVSSPLAGRVVSISADIGTYVKSGQPMLVLDSPDLGSALADAQKAESELHHKEVAFQRSKTLYEGEVLAHKDLEDSEAAWQQARAEYERAKLRLANLHASHKTRGEAFSLIAPIAGMVIERNANPGTEVGPATVAPLFVISDPKRLWAMMDLPEHLLNKVKQGQAVSLESQAWKDVSFPATIERIAPALDPVTRRIQVRVAVPNPDGRLKPEMFVRVRLLAGDTAKVLRVPSSAVVTQGIAHFVFVERATGEFEKRRIEIALQDREDVYVSKGIAASEKIVQSGALLLASELSGGE